MGVEVGAGSEHSSAVGIGRVQLERNDGLFRLGLGGPVILTDGEHQAPRRDEAQPGVPEAVGRREDAIQAVLDEVHSTVRPRTVRDQAVPGRPRAAAVLVHGTADVGARRHLGGVGAR